MNESYSWMVYDRLTERVVCFCANLDEATKECKKVHGYCGIMVSVPSSAVEWYEASIE